MVLDLIRKVKDAELCGGKVVDGARAEAEATVKRAREEGGELLEGKKEELKGEVQTIIAKYEREARTEAVRLEKEGGKEKETVKR